MKNRFQLYILLVFCTFLFNCEGNSNTKKEEQTTAPIPYFEGEIVLTETRDLSDRLFEVETIFILSENSIKREQRLDGVGDVFDDYAGVFVDLEKDSIIFYYVHEASKKYNKHSVSIKEYNSNTDYNYFPNTVPSPIDNTFKLISEYSLAEQVKDSTTIIGYTSDYTRYEENTGFLMLEVFDSKKIKVKRELLEIVFLDLPAEINFLLMAEVQRSKTEREEKKSKKNWVDLGLDLLNKTVDLTVHIKKKVSTLTKRIIGPSEKGLPAVNFTEIPDFNEFVNSYHTASRSSFDD